MIPVLQIEITKNVLFVGMIRIERNKMCWKYEGLYDGHCLDLVWEDLYDTKEPTIISVLEDRVGVEFVDDPRQEFYALLESWHERGIIRPK